MEPERAARCIQTRASQLTGGQINNTGCDTDACGRLLNHADAHTNHISMLFISFTCNSAPASVWKCYTGRFKRII